jgi:hypothetical protein
MRFEIPSLKPVFNVKSALTVSPITAKRRGVVSRDAHSHEKSKNINAHNLSRNSYDCLSIIDPFSWPFHCCTDHWGSEMVDSHDTVRNPIAYFMSWKHKRLNVDFSVYVVNWGLYTFLARFQVFTAASLMTTVFWDVAPCSLVEVYRRFRGAYCLHHRGGCLRTRRWEEYLDLRRTISFLAQLVIVLSCHYTLNDLYSWCWETDWLTDIVCFLCSWDIQLRNFSLLRNPVVHHCYNKTPWIYPVLSQFSPLRYSVICAANDINYKKFLVTTFRRLVLSPSSGKSMRKMPTL